MRRALPCWMPFILILVFALLSACHQAPRTQLRPGPAVPAAENPGGAQLAIDPEQSQVLILVYREGRMAALGHNHVIAVRELSGTVSASTDLSQSSWQLAFPVAAMSVDEAPLRASLGPDFQTTVDTVAIAGTRDHMLGPALLDADHYPRITLQAAGVHTDPDGVHVTARITVRDHVAQIEVPVSLQRTAGQIIVSGEFDLTHAQLGLTPYSVALGALRVAERMHVRFRLLAH
ncbi:MAG TPA: YceI family protein [Steroidobacteraceae bacterium]